MWLEDENCPQGNLLSYPVSLRRLSCPICGFSISILFAIQLIFALAILALSFDGSGATFSMFLPVRDAFELPVVSRSRLYYIDARSGDERWRNRAVVYYAIVSLMNVLLSRLALHIAFLLIKFVQGLKVF